MTRHDYSHDAELLDWEEIDYDTKYGKETGINVSRMRLPNAYDISKYYKRYSKNYTVNGVQRKKGEYGNWKMKPKENLPAITDDFDWQIFYNFPNTLHPSIKNYGGKNVTYRRLYLILCEAFNSGEYFVDKYFDEVYPNTMKPTVDAELTELKAYLLTTANEMTEGLVARKDGQLKKSYSVQNKGGKAKIERYQKLAKEWEGMYGEYISGLIKDDIINRLMLGEIPLRHRNATSTKLARAYIGISEEPEFFAFGSLIESIQLHVKIGSKGKWRTQQGLLV